MDLNCEVAEIIYQARQGNILFSKQVLLLSFPKCIQC